MTIFSLIFVNLIAIFLAVYEKWDLHQVLLVYWCQSLIIGVFQFKKILDLKKFSTKNFKIGNIPVKPNKFVKLFSAFFFLIHYGLFHFGYLVFIFFIVLKNVINKNTIQIAWGYIAIVSIFFFFNHLFSYFQNKKQDSKKILNIGTLMFRPYLRIIPMHFVVIIAFALENNLVTLVVFMTLKTIIDIFLHIIEHKKKKINENQ